MKILQIVPRLKPDVDGVGDYALTLAWELRNQQGVETVFLVCDLDWVGSEEITNFRIYKSEKKSSRILVQQLNEIFEKEKFQNIVLNYVGYGYEKRGCPFWLIEGLRSFKILKPSCKLYVVFHEVSASSWRPWTSSFWNGWLQRRLSAHMLSLSDSAITNNTSYAQILGQMNPLKKVTVSPVFSNVGESHAFSDWIKRENTAVLFGVSRHNFLKNPKKLSKVLKQLNIKKIYDIGYRFSGKYPVVEGVSLEPLGKLDSEMVHDVLEKCRFGFINNPLSVMGKSGVFAAYCAHGIVPIVDAGDKASDGLEEGVHFVQFKKLNGFIPCMDYGLIAKNAFDWYQEHNIEKSAEIFLRLIAR